MATDFSSPLSTTFKLESALLSSKIGIVYTEWNSDIINKLLKGAGNSLIKFGFKEKQIVSHQVPGSFELPLGAQYLIDYAGVESVICLGCLIKGETPHFEYISESVSIELGRLNTKHSIPVIFGVLTVNTKEQALERSGGKYGNKGSEAAISALKMMSLKHKLKSKKAKQVGI